MGTIERSVSYISSSFFLSFSSFSFSFSTRHIHIQVNTMGFFHHESDEAKAHEEVSLLFLSLYFNSLSSSFGIYLGHEQWTQGSVIARAHCCRCFLRGNIVNVCSSSYHTLINSYQAAKKYQEYQEKNGKPASHAKAKELLYVFLTST